MRRSSPITLLASFAIALVIAFGFEWLQVANGRPILPPVISMGIVLAVLGLIILLMAVPIKRATSGKSKSKPVNPFVAVRVALAARAGAITGALFGGIGVGILLFCFTRPFFPSHVLVDSIFAIVGAVVLLVSSLIAEWFCVIPPDDLDSEKGLDSSVPGAADKNGAENVNREASH